MMNEFKEKAILISCVLDMVNEEVVDYLKFIIPDHLFNFKISKRGAGVIAVSLK